MTVHEIIGASGSWEVKLTDAVPDEIYKKIQPFGHVAIIKGRVDVDADASSLLTKARYVGVVRRTGKSTDRTIGGPGMLTWLGDEDEKGKVIENTITVTAATITAAITAVLPPAVTIGNIFALANPAARYTGKFQYVSPRTAIKIICDAFGVEFRVNGNGTIDVGRQDQLYTAVPDSIIVRKGAGTDLDLVALGGTFDTQIIGDDYTTRTLLLGTKIGSGTTPDTTFVTAHADAATVPYSDIHGNPVALTRMISESSTDNPANATARAQLFLNQYNRLNNTFTVTAEDYEIDGNFRCGDNTFVYDPDNGIVNANYERTFRAELLHPDIVRVSEVDWPVSDDYTIAYRDGAGNWTDLTRFVNTETGTTQLVVGDLPKQLTDAGKYSVGDRANAGSTDKVPPQAPTGLGLTTNSVITGKGTNSAVITASWTAPTMSADGTGLTDLAYYSVQYRRTGTGTGAWISTAVNDVTVDLPAAISLSYDVRVAAVDQSNNFSAYTATQTIVSAADTVSPPAPADPVVTNYLGQLRIEYSGTDNLGNPMPTDANRVDVHVDTTNAFTPTIANRVSSLTPFAKGVAYATAPYGATRYVRLVAYDHTGNASAASGTVSAATSWVNTGDIANLAITNALISDLSAGKITAGTMSADVITSGRFTTALTGARREMNAVGFQAFDSSSNLLVNLDGVNNLLTGILKTALTGRRIEIGAGGTSGRVTFYAPTGEQSYLESYTIPSSGNEGISLKMPISGAGVYWNTLRIDSGELAFMNSQFVHFAFAGHGSSGGGNFEVAYALNLGTSTTAPSLQTRFHIDPYITQFLDNDVYFQWSGTNQRAFFSTVTSAASSAGLYMFNGTNNGGLLKYHYPGSGAQRLEARQFDDATAIEVYASAFTVVSAEKVKHDITPFAGDSLAALKKLNPVTFRRERGKNKDGSDMPEPELELGVIAGDAPPELQTFDDDGVPYGVNIGPWLTLLTATVQQLADDVAAMKRGKS